MKYDPVLYKRVIELTKAIAKEKGILWEEEQAEIVYEVVTERMDWFEGDGNGKPV
jgi:hypothetical protein